MLRAAHAEAAGERSQAEECDAARRAHPDHQPPVDMAFVVALLICHPAASPPQRAREEGRKDRAREQGHESSAHNPQGQGSSGAPETAAGGAVATFLLGCPALSPEQHRREQPAAVARRHDCHTLGILRPHGVVGCQVRPDHGKGSGSYGAGVHEHDREEAEAGAGREPRHTAQVAHRAHEHSRECDVKGYVCGRLGTTVAAPVPTWAAEALHVLRFAPHTTGGHPSSPAATGISAGSGGGRQRSDSCLIPTNRTDSLLKIVGVSP
jgi:hypothetical protein